MNDEVTADLLHQTRALSADLLHLYEEFVEFQDSCAFFCDAMTAMLKSQSELGPSTLEGVADFSQHIKTNGGVLKAKLRGIQEGMVGAGTARAKGKPAH